jgi:branched-chain amino acid aminotransferase
MGDAKWIWVDGKLVPHERGTIPVGSVALHFGPVVFDGIRCYGLGDGRTNVFRLREHIERLYASAASAHLEIPFSASEVEAACKETVLANGSDDAYLRVTVFPGSGALGFGRPGGPAKICILTFPWQNAHLERSQRNGISIHVSSVIRTEARRGLSKAKLSAHYVAGLLAIREAREAGCDDAFLLDATGAVAEATTANIFGVWNERLVSPPAHLPILPGITRSTLFTLAKENGIEAVEETFDTQRLASADEVFIAGTTAEVTPVREVGGRKVREGAPAGPITTKLLAALQRAVRGEGPDYGWAHSLRG